MCRCSTREHKCGHLSSTWIFCPWGSYDVNGQRRTPCQSVEFERTRAGKLACPLANCVFRLKGGRWTCCCCLHAPNVKGWCENMVDQTEADGITGIVRVVKRTCDHGCCDNCQPC
ncbi:hypothetical protein CDD83_3420 [Cordyceps sp. RAO-2017]|nr:hypothetical protein CDD83_3420 [Cordyceps sp. RAO-2017]